MVRRLDAVSLSGLEAAQDERSHRHCEGFARFVQHVAEDAPVVEN